MKKKAAAKKRHGGGRRKAGADLASHLAKALAGHKGGLGIAEAAAAAKKAGYQTSSPAFTRIVAIRLSTDKRFKRVSRGVYTNKKG